MTHDIAVESQTDWVGELRGSGAAREAALGRLHQLLLRIAVRETQRRSPGFGGPELSDLAHQAAADALVAILAKLATFRGESRFTTWAYRFVVLEVAGKLGRHYWHRHPPTNLDEPDWERLADRFGDDPGARVEHAELVVALRTAIEETLTDRQRQLFVAVVVNRVPLDAVVARLGISRNAIYKTIFDARRKIRAHLVAAGHLPEAGEPA